MAYTAGVICMHERTNCVRLSWALPAWSRSPTHEVARELKRLGVPELGTIEALVFPFGGDCRRKQATRLVNLAQGKASDRPAPWPINSNFDYHPHPGQHQLPLQRPSVMYGPGGNVDGFACKFALLHPC